MGVGLDTGDMISQAVVPLAEDETGGSLFDKLAEEGAALLIRTIPSIVDGTAVYTKQPEESPTPYAAMISKKMGLMDFSKSAVELERLVCSHCMAASAPAARISQALATLVA